MGNHKRRGCYCGVPLNVEFSRLGFSPTCPSQMKNRSVHRSILRLFPGSYIVNSHVNGEMDGKTNRQASKLKSITFYFDAKVRQHSPRHPRARERRPEARSHWSSWLCPPCQMHARASMCRRQRSRTQPNSRARGGSN